MVHLYNYKNLTWVDLASPTREEVRSIMETYKIDPAVAEELLSPTLKPRVDLFPEYIYMILHFPAFKHTHQHANQEIDFIIGKDFIITTRYDTIDPLHKFSKVFEVNSILDKSNIGEHAGYIFFYMVTKLYKSLHHELDFINDELREIEGKIFLGDEKEMVFEISKVGRELLRFRQSLIMHKEILDSLEVAGKKFFGEDFAFYLKAIVGSYVRVYHAIQSGTETMQELRETNNSMLSTKQNETMRTLAIISFLMFPITLVAGVFSLNTKFIPIVGLPGDFWYVISIMLALTCGVFIFFKIRRWL